MKTLTDDQYDNMGFQKLSNGSVKDHSGNIFFPKKSKSPAKAIRLFCKECNGLDRRTKEATGCSLLISECQDPCCPLFDFRFGKNPFYSRPMDKEENNGEEVLVMTV